MKIDGRIIDNEIVFDQKELSKLHKFLDGQSGTEVSVNYELHSGVKYWQHEYFHGYVLPDIARGQGETNLGNLKEFVLKEEYLKFKVSDLRDIPKRHLKKCRILQREVESLDGTIYTQYEYVPSLSVISEKEYRQFIKTCEEVRDYLINWEYDDFEAVKKMTYYRKLAMEV